MKKRVLMFLIILFPLQVFAQKVMEFSTGALIDASTQDSAMVTSTTVGLTGVRVFRSSVSQDTIVTKWVRMVGLNGDMTLEFRKVNVSGTDSVQLNMEIFRGAGIPDSSGISRHQIVLSNANLTATYHLSDSTFVKSRLFNRYRFSFYERAAQQNDYILTVHQYSPDGNAGSDNLLK